MGAELILGRTYDENGEKEESQNASLTLTGSLTCSDNQYPLAIKAAKNREHDSYASYVDFDANEVIATISEEMSTDEEILKKLGFEEGQAKVSNNQIISNGAYKYALCAEDDSTKRYFWSVDTVRAYISENNNESATYYLFLSNNATLEEDLDFSNLPYSKIRLNLDNNVLTIDKDLAICVSNIFNGSIAVNNGATLTLLAAKNE